MSRPVLNYMKQLFLLAVFAILLFAEFIVQNEPMHIDSKYIPYPVSASFAQSFPLVNEVNWVKGNNFYEARYDARFRENVAMFDLSGNLIATGSRIRSKDLPPVVRNFTSTNYPGKRIRKSIALFFNDGKKVSYEIQISGVNVLLDEEGRPVMRSK
jgi:hypothetical protein